MAFDHLDLITVQGQARTLDGKIGKGRITFTASASLLVDTTTGQGIFPVGLQAILDVTGSFSIDLPATNDPDISPVGWVYDVRVDIEGAARDTFRLAVPFDVEGPIDLFLAAPADDSGVVYVPPPTVSASDVLTFAMMMGS